MIVSRRISRLVTSLLLAAAAISACLVLLDGIATTEAGIDDISNVRVERTSLSYPVDPGTRSSTDTSSSLELANSSVSYEQLHKKSNTSVNSETALEEDGTNVDSLAVARLLGETFDPEGPSTRRRFAEWHERWGDHK